MERKGDDEIVALYLARDENAIEKTKERFSAYCRKVLSGFLRDERDIDECENDVYLAAWQSIPPNEPRDLATYLGKIARRKAYARYEKGSALKRGGLGEAMLELEDTICSSENVEDALSGRELSCTISVFLRTLSERDRTLFVRRYWFGDSISRICSTFGLKKSNAKMLLQKIRNDLRDYLRKEGYEL